MMRMDTFAGRFNANDANAPVPAPEGIVVGPSTYQNTLYCRKWGAFINPTGFTCRLCIAQNWPQIVRYRAHVLPALVASDKSKAEDALVAAVKSKMLTLDEATALAAEFGIGQE